MLLVVEHNYADRCSYLKFHFAMQTPTIQHYTTYSKEDVTSCACKMARLVLNMGTCKQQAVRTKYSSRKFMKVATSEELKGDVIQFFARTSSQ